MSVSRLISLALLFCFCAETLAQSSMQVLQGSRHDGPGRVAPSGSTFALGMTRDNGATWVTTASRTETVRIRGEVRPEAADIGRSADIFVVDRLLNTNEFRMRTRDHVWVPWNVRVADLVPFQENVVLGSAFPVEMFTGTLGTAGNHRLFLGYMAGDGILRYHTSGLPLTITEPGGQSAHEQAFNLFVSIISPQIVATRCITCHVPGGTAPSVGAYALQAPPQNNLQVNFDIFDNLVALRGTAFILSKATGGSDHSGGVQMTAGTAEYQSFADFLNLLAQ